MVEHRGRDDRVTAYAAVHTYDANNRLTTGPAGTYTDGDSSHVDALTSTGGGYTASYDAAGGHELSRAEQQPDVQRDGDGAEYDV
jgi:hypothetical protein